MSDSDKAKCLLRSGKRISKAFEVVGCTGKATEVKVSGPLDAVAGYFGVRKPPEGLGTGIFKFIRGMMALEGPADGGSPQHRFFIGRSGSKH